MQVISQALGRYVSPEMLALGLAEMMLTFVLTVILFTPATGHIDAATINPALICAVTVGFIAFVVGLYRPEIFQRAGRLVISTFLSALLSFPTVWVITKALGVSSYWPVGYDSLRPVKIVVIWSCGLLVIRIAFLVATRCNLFVHRAALVGSADPVTNAFAAKLSRRGFLEIKIVRPEQASAASLHAQRIRTLVFPNADAGRVVPAIKDEYRRFGIKIENQSEFWEFNLKRTDISNLTDAWFEAYDPRARSRLSVVSIRCLDVVSSVALLVTTLPIMVIVALLVKIDSAGPILYKQERVGLHGKLFTLLKFRSMRSNAEASGPSWAQDRDPRVTRVGSFMRKCRIDELPQLLNVVRGEMSFIGPRPERPHFVEQLSQIIPFYERRADVKPGLTGWAQVNYPYGASVEDARAKLSFDLYYVKHRNMMLDLLIILSTVRVILFQEGAR